MPYLSEEAKVYLTVVTALPGGSTGLKSKFHCLVTHADPKGSCCDTTEIDWKALLSFTSAEERASCSDASEMSHLTLVSVISSSTELHLSVKLHLEPKCYTPTLNLSPHFLYVTARHKKVTTVTCTIDSSKQYSIVLLRLMDATLT